MAAPVVVSPAELSTSIGRGERVGAIVRKAAANSPPDVAASVDRDSGGHNRRAVRYAGDDPRVQGGAVMDVEACTPQLEAHDCPGSGSRRFGRHVPRMLQVRGGHPTAQVSAAVVPLVASSVGMESGKLRIRWSPKLACSPTTRVKTAETSGSTRTVTRVDARSDGAPRKLLTRAVQAARRSKSVARSKVSSSSSASSIRETRYTRGWPLTLASRYHVPALQTRP